MTSITRLTRVHDKNSQRFITTIDRRNKYLMIDFPIFFFFREIKDLKKTLKSSREMKMNEQLNKQSQKRVLVPDILQEHITRHVGFISRRQDIRSTIEPLQPVRIYMVHDNIDITEENYSSHYSNVNDSITYNILLKPTKHEGGKDKYIKYKQYNFHNPR